MYKFNELTEKKYVENVIPMKYYSRGILMSEGFAFCSFCELHNVDLIIESGIYGGQSTRIWSRFFKDIPIISVDKILKGEVIDEFKDVKNVTLVKADAKSFLPDYISKNPGKRIGVFIDGPKGEEAIQLLKKCFEIQNVFVAGMHDVHKLSFEKPNNTREILDKEGIIHFFTDDKEFVEVYSYLDSDKNMVGRGTEDIFWSPGKLNSKEFGVLRLLGSYGPTVAIMLK